MKKKFSRLLATLLAVLLLMGTLPILPHAEEEDAEAYVIVLLCHTLPGGKVFGFGYEYNDGKNGNILAITQDGLRHEYGYDKIGQLKQDKAIVTKTVTETAEVTEEVTDEETGEVITEVTTEVTETQVTEETVTTYDYDIGGNLETVTENGIVTKRFEYGGGLLNPGWMDQLTKFNGQTLIYDEIGNLETYDNHTYKWVKARQLESITGPTINASYTYDYTGLRKSKTVGGVTTEFIWAGGLLMAQIGSDGNTIAWHYDQSGKMMGFTLNNIPYFYLRNLQGDIIAIHDAAGNVVAEYEYDVWGKVLSATGPLAGINPIRYRGYYYDNETGFYYCQSRYYNPQWCRWISADVHFDTQDGIMGTNMYAYCLNDPINLMDPSGNIATAAVAAGAWAASMWWLTLVDGPLPVGDIIYAAGIGIAAGAAAIAAASIINESAKMLADAYLAAEAAVLSAQAAKALVKDLGGIASKFPYGKCVDAAKALAKYLALNSIEFSVIAVVFPGDIVGSLTTGQRVSEYHFHIGVNVGGVVFCNIHPYGLKKNLWINDFSDFLGSKPAVIELGTVAAVMKEVYEQINIFRGILK